MYQDYKDLCPPSMPCVRYLIVEHTRHLPCSARFTKDIDLFIQPTRERASGYAALAGSGAVEAFDRKTCRAWQLFRFGRDPHGFDILPEIPGSI